MSMVDELNIQISADVGGASASISGVAQSLENLGGSADNAKGGMSDFVAVMSGIAQQMQQLTSLFAVDSFKQFNENMSAAASHLQLADTRLQLMAKSSTGAAEMLNDVSKAAGDTAYVFGAMQDAATGFGEQLSNSSVNTSKSFTELQEELLKNVKALQESSQTTISFSGNMEKAGKEAQDAAKRIDELSKKLKSMDAKPVTSLEAAFKKLKGTVATLGIGKFLKDSNDAYVVQMQNELKLTAHMKHRMNATDEEIQSIKDLASAQQKIGVIGDEIQLAGAQQLTTYAKQSSTLKTLIPAMNELIAQNAGYEASTGDAISMADALGRALNGQYTSLKRMGVSFTEAQVQVLKYGTESQKAAVLAEAIGDRVGNINEMLRNTPTGQVKGLSNDFGDLREQIGATFQPLISTIVPVLSGLMETLGPPIKTVTTGISTIGAAIASLDNPATRAIGLTVGAIAVLYKLKALMGGTAAGLLVIGAALAAIVGAQQDQNTIDDTVKDAMDRASSSTDNATDAAKDYKEAVEDVQKAASKLAGFDTITKLSGSGSTGSLSSDFFGDEDFSEYYDAADAANAVKDALDGIKLPTLDFGDIGKAFENFKQEAEKFATGLDFVFKHWGDNEAIYKPLKRLTGQIENILNAVGFDGTGFVNFWQDIGSDVYNALAGGDSQILKGLNDIDKAFRETFGDLAVWHSNLWRGIGSDMYASTHQEELKANDLKSKYSNGDFNEIVVDYLKQGKSAEAAVEYAKKDYLTTDEAMYWYNSLLDGNERTTSLKAELWRNQLIASGQLPQLPAPAVEPNKNYQSPATRSTADIPSYVSDKNITFNAWINDERADVDRTTITN